MKLETFSYLPPMTQEQVSRQIRYILSKGLIPAIEYTCRPGADQVYWSLWKLPLFGAKGPEDVLAEIEACKAANPGCFVKLNGYDNVKQGQVVSFVVYRPESSGTAHDCACDCGA